MTPSSDAPSDATRDNGAGPRAWPALPYPEWKETLATLHMWLQMVGKIRVAQAPWVNHQWHVTLHPTSRGLTTRPMPHGDRTFQIDVDFLGHELRITTSDGGLGQVALKPRTVADFHRALTSELHDLDLPVHFHGVPNELPDPIPFAEDERDGNYQPEVVERFFQALSSTARVFEDFRGGFIGKSSPVHFFWGAMDLAVTRFSGREAPEHPGGIPHLPDWITREAYSHEVSSAGFWPGGDAHPYPFFYAYAYPNPEGYQTAAVEPAGARWDTELMEFILPYDEVRSAPVPEEALMSFLNSTYEAAASLGDWNRDRVEWGRPGRPPIGGFGRT